ncbi:Eco57I restriction-modification methylase domain-containing protein [Micromonospora aurantiaca (nom. illeg.)]|uniref:Eco57I restriction-modification methylase domain-containing protein n=1 Tax=Micromonospora aurantiaca (nom. illeg.) TaxID=47850 RepID=UPI003F49D239
MRLTNAQIGPALRALFVDIGPDGARGPVDFRALSVREFGTIYEGLLESSLSLAPSDLTVDPTTNAFLPAKPGDAIVVRAGEVYFHNASGARKSTGSYFTKQFAVEHLLNTALEPAITDHLSRVKAALEAADEAKATELFFDFRVADLAMGSGHFLVAAIDRIESRFTTFLATHPIPSVADELNRLAAAARHALGSSAADIEIEPSALLRRQIARRCIYGLDLNLMAVELARLGIWIHTFVPGLPMSALDHGLVVGNSLTGIGTLEEVLDVLEPQRTPGQYSLFLPQIETALSAAKERLLRAARTAEATKSEVREAAEAYSQAVTEAADAKALFDAAVAVRLGLVSLPSSPEVAIREGDRADVGDKIAKFAIAHLPYLFPEVFLRENPGFDVLLGNPPWEKVRHEPHQFWVIRDPGLRSLKGRRRDDRISWLRQSRPLDAAAEEREQSEREELKELLARGYKWQKSQHYDFAKIFAERNLRLVRVGGSVGIILPQALLVLGGWAPIREPMIRQHKVVVFPLRNRGEWLFDGVDVRMTVCLLALTAGEGVTVHSAADSLSQFRVEQESEGLHLSIAELADLSDELNVPWFEHSRDPEVFTALSLHPRLGSGLGWVKGTADSTRWDFSGSGRHKDFASEASTPGAWRVTMTRHVDAYRLTDDVEGKFVQTPSDLAATRRGVSIIDGRVVLDNSHPPIVFRFPARNDDSRTLIATALPQAGWLYSKGYAHGVRMDADVSTTDILALLGFLNSVPADWWARRFVDRHVGKRVIDGMPLPDWSPAEREEVATLVARLLQSNGYSSLAGGRVLPAAVDAPHDPIKLKARIEALAARGLGLSPNQVETIFLDFEETPDALPQEQRDAIRQLLKQDVVMRRADG